MSESKVIWHSIEKEGIPPSDCDAVLVSMQTLIGDKPEVFEAVWNGRCWTDTYEGYYNFEKSEFGIIIMDLSLFDFGPKPPCGYIKAKHIRPAYGKGTRPVKAHKRITRTREGFRK